jgi:hypothetical protein
VGVGIGVAVGDGVGDGFSVGVGVTVGTGVVVGDGDGVDVGVGIGVAFGDGVGDGVGVGTGCGVPSGSAGVAITMKSVALLPVSTSAPELRTRSKMELLDGAVAGAPSPPAAATALPHASASMMRAASLRSRTITAPPVDAIPSLHVAAARDANRPVLFAMRILAPACSALTPMEARSTRRRVVRPLADRYATSSVDGSTLPPTASRSRYSSEALAPPVARAAMRSVPSSAASTGRAGEMKIVRM